MATTDETFGESLAIDGPDGSRALIARHGGHVYSWRDAAGRERLFLSSRAASHAPHGEPQAIRGGVPVCFPQFAGLGRLPKHGFARLVQWRPVPGRGMSLSVEPGDWPGFSHRLELELFVQPEALRLELEFVVHNRGREAFEFTAALHTYLAVPDVTRLEVRGGAGLVAREVGREDFIQPGALAFGGEVDRQWLGLTRPLEVWDTVGHAGAPLAQIEQSGFRDAVLWNIGEAKSAGLADLGPGEWRRYLCVEAAEISAPQRLEPDERWTGSQRLVLS